MAVGEARGYRHRQKPYLMTKPVLAATPKPKTKKSLFATWYYSGFGRT